MEAREHPFAPITLVEADSLLSNLSTREKIAQLFVLQGRDSTAGPVSGFILAPENINEPNNVPLEFKGIPSYMGIDFLHSGETCLPSALLGEQLIAASNDTELVGEYAYALGRDLEARSFNFILGPSLDIYNNDMNPYTGHHSFGDSAAIVARYATAVFRGMESAGIMTVMGRYPGLGNMDRGMEQDAPLVRSGRDEQNSGDLVPFKALINIGMPALVMGNAYVPAMDSSPGTLASTSPAVNQMLREKLGFNGLIWTDLRSVSNAKKAPSPVDLLLAGSEVIIIDKDPRGMIEQVESAVQEGVISPERLDEMCKKIIQSKLWMKRPGAQKSKQAPERQANYLEWKERLLVSSSLTLIRNSNDLIPLKRLDTLSVALIRIGPSASPVADTLVQRYGAADYYDISLEALEEGYSEFQKAQDKYDLAIVLAHPENGFAKKRFGLGEHYQSVIERIAYSKKTILAWSGHPRAMQLFSSIRSIEGLLLAYAPGPWTDDYVIQAIYGGRALRGRLPRTIFEGFESGFGITTEKTRLGYGVPEEVGIQSEDLAPIYDLAHEGIREMAYPGCQIWFAKDGIVVLNKAFGYHTYEKDRLCTTSDLYDLASITKIAASVAGLMKLSDEGKLNLDYNLCDYVPEWTDTTEYMNMNLREILAHQAGLPAFIPFYSKTLVRGIPRYDVYSLAPSETYPYRVARDLYIHKDYPARMFKEVVSQPISTNKEYKYSDIGYYFALRIIEKLGGTTLDRYVDSVFYRPLGMHLMTYRPLEKFDKSRIPPTEYDRFFRKQLVHGDVHDPGAAMLGGVGGHAGLFSNANDLGKLMQMYLNGGDYGGEHFLAPETISDFVRCQFCESENRRGAGFDKPFLDGTPGPSCGCTDLDAFGHQGFTGTVTWADPGHDVVYVFLSNRVYPNADNKKLADLNIRTRVQGAFYRAIEKGRELAREGY